LIGHGLKLEHCIQIGINVHFHSSRIWDVVDSQNYTFKEHILVLFRIHLELFLVQHYMVVQTWLCLHTQPLVMVCMCMYVVHVLISMNNQNRSNMLYFKTWIIWNKSLLTIYWIFNFFTYWYVNKNWTTKLWIHAWPNTTIWVIWQSFILLEF